MASRESNILMILIIIILLIAASIIIIRLLFYSIPPQSAVNTSPGQLNYNCGSNECDVGLVCDPELRVCKLADGEACNNAYECLTTSYCNLTCTSRDGTMQAVTGVTGDPCPCDYRTHACIDGRCLSLTSCSVDSDCVSGLCNSGTCSLLLENGDNCNDDLDCRSTNCSAGICQIRGIETGQIGSICTNDSMCNNPLICNNGACRIP